MKKLIISIWLMAGMILVPCRPCHYVAEGATKTGGGETKSDQMLQLSPQARELLDKNGFAVVASKAYKEMNEAYQAFHAASLPIFVTTDSIFHATHLLLDYALRIIEVDYLMSDLKQLTRFMIDASCGDYRKAKDTDVKNAVYANIAFFSVAARLLGEDEIVPHDVTDVVEAELRLIRDHEGFKKSPVFGYLEDYSQYVPRGHYTRNERFKSYFQAMMWYGRIGFYLNPNSSLEITRELTRQLTRQALLIVRALDKSEGGGGKAFDAWQRIYQATSFFVGTTDDLDLRDYERVALKTYGKLSDIGTLADESSLEKFMSQARVLRKPRILSTFVLDTEDASRRAEEITLGFRFMGQRFTPDSHIFQNLVYPKVMLYTGNSMPFTWVMSRRGPIRGFPRGLDIMAVLGSVDAEGIIREEGDGDYEGYNRQLEKLKKEFALKQDEWSVSLYWSWLYCLKPLLARSAGPFPPFMRSGAWAGKALHTALGSWAELRHDTILYAKQSYTMAGTGRPRQPELTRGYVEPHPEVFARVRQMIQKMKEGLAAWKLIDERVEESIRRHDALLAILERIARTELAGKTLTEADYRTVWNIGSTLESITSPLREAVSGTTSETDEKMAVIADVHTDPNSGQVLEEAVGYPFIIYANVLVEGEESIVAGPVFSYYEFKQPMADRLTDEQWQQMLRSGKEPPLPRWISSFLAEKK